MFLVDEVNVLVHNRCTIERVLLLSCSPHPAALITSPCFGLFLPRSSTLSHLRSSVQKLTELSSPCQDYLVLWRASELTSLNVEEGIGVIHSLVIVP